VPLGAIAATIAGKLGAGTGETTASAAAFGAGGEQDAEQIATMTANIQSVRRTAEPPGKAALRQGAIGVLFATLVFAFHPIHLTREPAANALTFVDRSGLALGTILAGSGDRRVRVPLEAVAPTFLQTLVLTEDARFFQHRGVDGIALVRAVGEALVRRHIVSGGSTITMQLARLRENIPRTPLGKLREIVEALRIEAATPKETILADYVNRLPMGANIIGVEAAARTYFGVPASDLDLAQAAFLVAIPNDPTRLDPYLHRRALEARRRMILRRLVAIRAVTAEDARLAERETLTLQPRSAGIYAAPHLLFQLAASLSGQTSPIHTTIDRELQTYVEAQAAHVVATLRERNVNDAAALVVDNHSGAILAYVGSPDYFDDAHFGRNDGVVALRQPGSALKPFLYELAFERRTIRPTTILADVPTTYALPGLHLYAPLDYSTRFAGPVRARVALADSLNVPAVRVLARVGVAEFLKRLHALGFAHLRRTADYYGLGLTLGGGEVTLEELAQAYVLAANDGRVVTLHALAGVAPAPSRSVGDPQTWALVSDMLADAHARAASFGVDSLLRTPFPSAVKTGTSSDFRDTWTIGYTRDYTVATWVGNFNGSRMRGVSGVTGAAPLWNRIMLHLAAKHEPAAFATPRGYVYAAMCATTGLRPTPRCPAVVTELLDPGDVSRLAQSPRPLSSEYDTWLAAQPPSPNDDFRIVAPRDGAQFVAAPGARIALDVRGARGPVQWRLNGRALATHDARWMWTLERGRWSFTAQSHDQHATTTITVGDTPARGSALGFSVLR
jgi:penicillin-binding protein 1C